jgi:ribosomal protein L13
MLSETETKRLMRQLRIYNDQNHPHQAQNPIEINVSNFHSNSKFSVDFAKLV